MLIRWSRGGPVAALAIATSLCGLPALADDPELAADLHWASTYTEIQLGEGRAARSGILRGLLFDIENGPLHLSSVVCPFVENSDGVDRLVSMSAHCALTAAEGDQAYLSFSCVGDDNTSGCDGYWRFIGGSGGFATIAGDGDMIISTLVVNPDGVSAVGTAYFTGLYRGLRGRDIR